MAEGLAQKLKSYYAAPADASVTEKFAGWTQEDFDALDAYLEAHPVHNREESVALEKRLAAGIL